MIFCVVILVILYVMCCCNVLVDFGLRLFTFEALPQVRKVEEPPEVDSSVDGVVEPVEAPESQDFCAEGNKYPWVVSSYVIVGVEFVSQVLTRSSSSHYARFVWIFLKLSGVPVVS